MRAARTALQTVAAIPLLCIVLHALAAWGAFPQGSLLSGASYLPPWWIGALVLPVSLACWMVGAKKTGIGLAIAYGVGVVPNSDFSLRSSGKPPSSEAARLSVVALNVQYYSFGVENVVRAIKQVDADVALLSENVLDESEAQTVIRELHPRSFRMGRSGETAIASKYPMVSFKEVEFPTFQASLSGPNRLEQSQNTPHRSFSHAVIDVDGIRVNVLSVRLIAGRAPATGPLSQISWGVYLMRSQNTEVAFLKDYLARLQGPYIFGGDLNAPPSAPAVRSLREVAMDAYMATHHIGKPTFRVRAPLLRIDYVFGSGDLVPLQSRRVEIEISDHFPLFAEFQLTRLRAQRPRAGVEIDGP
jgi:endonuclease/exonuclease/phosphatase (EEP) superfamily protein YafD